ncbi:MAG: GAF domain-containing sensor histidine kinase [Chloroflexales bacterium]|nr:GAF domain-containing sensor histidine kinase [Chloroflexales bacterium]
MADPLLQSDAAQLQRRNRELSILNAIASALNRSVDLEAALQATLVQVADLLDLRTAWIWLLHESNGEFYLAAAQNLPPALADNPARMEGSCYCLDTYRDGDLNGAANVNVVTCTRLKWLVDGTDGLRYHACIPLYAHGKQLGVLNVASPDWRELAADDLRLLYTVGDLLSIAVERARLFARSAQLGALEERNRLAREIHDTLAQGLTAIALQLESADALLEANANPMRSYAAVGKALELARINLEEARRSVLDLRAAPLEGRTLAQALTDLAKTPVNGVAVTLTATGAGRPLSPRVEVGLYRIVQEALTNAIRHAQARTIAITLITTPESIRCSITDDGCGFDPATVTQGHYGLVGLSERARLLGGTLALHTGPGLGTRIEITIPLK